MLRPGFAIVATTPLEQPRHFLVAGRALRIDANHIRQELRHVGPPHRATVLAGVIGCHPAARFEIAAGGIDTSPSRRRSFGRLLGLVLCEIP